MKERWENRSVPLEKRVCERGRRRFPLGKVTDYEKGIDAITDRVSQKYNKKTQGEFAMLSFGLYSIYEVFL